MHRTSWQDRIAEAAASKKERTKQLLARMKERRAAVEAPEFLSLPMEQGRMLRSAPPSRLIVTLASYRTPLIRTLFNSLT